MRNTQIMIMVAAAIVIVAGIVAVSIDDETDAAVCIGTWGPDNNHTSNANNAYLRAGWQNQFTIDDVYDDEHVYFLNGSECNLVAVYGTVFTIVSSNTLGLDTSANAILGDLSGLGVVECTISYGSTTKTFYIHSVTDTTVYVDSVTVSMSPSNPTVGETVTFTANITPSNASNQLVNWSGYPFWNIFEEIDRTDNTITGYFTEPTTDSYINATAQYDWGRPSLWVESPDLHFDVVDVPDEGVCIGTWNADNNHESSDGYAYGRVSWLNNFTATSVYSGERIFVLDGSYFSIVAVHGTVLTIVSSNTLGLNQDGLGPNAIHGPLTGTGTVEITVSDDTTTRTFFVQSVKDVTVYVDSVTVSMSPSNPTVGETVTFTANITPSNASNQLVNWSGYPFWNIFEEIGRTDNTITGYFTEPTTDSIISATAQYDWGWSSWWVESPDLHFDVVQYVTDIEWYGDTTYQVGDSISIRGVGLPTTADDTRVTYEIIDGDDCLSDAGFTILGGPFTAKAVAAGTVVLKATAVDAGHYSETIDITIEGPDPIEITIFGPTSIDVGEDFTLVAQTTGGTGQGQGDAKVRWSIVSGSEYVDLDAIQINNNYSGTGVASGTVVFRATSIEDSSVYEDWTMQVLSGTISITGPRSIEVGEDFTIFATVHDSSGEPSTSMTVNWSIVSGSEYVELDWLQINNYIWGTAVAAGTTVFRATLTTDDTVTADWTLEIVGVPVVIPTSIDMTGPGTLKVGETGKIYANIVPTNAPNRGVLWSVTSGGDLIGYETDATYRGGMMTVTAQSPGTVTITATSTADGSVTGTYTLTIISMDSDDHRGTIQINSVVQALADALFGGNTTIAGIAIYALIILGVFLIIREPLPVLIVSMPVTLILTAIRVLSTDMTVILIIISVLGLALIARNMWRD